jgi:hypothetical protein
MSSDRNCSIPIVPMGNGGSLLKGLRWKSDRDIQKMDRCEILSARTTNLALSVECALHTALDAFPASGICLSLEYALHYGRHWISTFKRCVAYLGLALATKVARLGSNASAS